MSLDEPELVDSVLTFLSGYDTLEYSWVKATAVSVRLRILFVTLQNTNIEPDLSYVEYPIKILDSKERSTRKEKIRMYKIQWRHHTEEEATWETENHLQRNFPDFLRTNQGT